MDGAGFTGEPPAFFGGARFFAALKIVCALERAVFTDFAVVFLAVSR